LYARLGQNHATVTRARPSSRWLVARTCREYQTRDTGWWDHPVSSIPPLSTTSSVARLKSRRWTRQRTARGRRDHTSVRYKTLLAVFQPPLLSPCPHIIRSGHVVSSTMGHPIPVPSIHHDVAPTTPKLVNHHLASLRRHRRTRTTSGLSGTSPLDACLPHQYAPWELTAWAWIAAGNTRQLRSRPRPLPGGPCHLGVLRGAAGRVLVTGWWCFDLVGDRNCSP
jgi:hypothetical protein